MVYFHLCGTCDGKKYCFDFLIYCNKILFQVHRNVKKAIRGDDDIQCVLNVQNFI